MKDLIELLEVNKDELPSIYCDMDQVLCNFMKAADKAVGGSFVTHDKEDRWNKINQVKGFWENLEWMPGAKNLYKKIIKYDAHILSAYSGKDPTSKSGKMKWLARETKFKRSKIHLVMRSQKQQFTRHASNFELAQNQIFHKKSEVDESSSSNKKVSFCLHFRLVPC